LRDLIPRDSKNNPGLDLPRRVPVAIHGVCSHFWMPPGSESMQSEQPGPDRITIQSFNLLNAIEKVCAVPHRGMADLEIP